MIAKEIIKELYQKMDENQELEIFPPDWSLFGKVAKMFSDEVIERAIIMFPKHNVETPGKLFFFLCKKASKAARPVTRVDLPLIAKKL